jgi:glycosyltransferase involved in cell wall biosynthesis
MSIAQGTDILLDARVIERGHTGLSRYVRELSARIPSVSPLRITAMVTQQGMKLPGAAETMQVRAPFLHPAEQVELPLRVARWRAAGRPRGVFWVPAYNAACVSPGPLVLTIHDANHLALPDNASRTKTLYYATVVKLAVLRAETIITVSEFARREIVSRIGVPETKVRVIPLGVSPPPALTPEAIQAARAAHDLPESYVMYVGSFKSHKNVEMLLTSARFARDVPIVLVGGAEAELGNPLAAARSLGRRVLVIRSLPEAELWPLLAGASVFAFPSRYEGFGLPPLEAMSVGVPVVTTTAGALPEVVGDAALTVHPEDAEGFGQTIERVLGDTALAHALAAKGRARAAAASWEEAARRHARVLHDAAGG